MISNESSSNFSDIDCESQEKLGGAFAGVTSVLVPFIMLLLAILNGCYDEQKKRGRVLEKNGSIVFTDNEFELVGLLKTTYRTVFSLIILYLIFVVLILILDKKCSLETIPFQTVVPVFTFYGFIGYILYYADQSIVSNIRSLPGPDQSFSSQEISNLSDSINCKSYIRMLLEANPKIIFKYTEYHLGGSDEEVVDFERIEEFVYTKCDDVTCPKQLEDIEIKIDKRKPVILETIIKIVCGDDITKTKFSNSWNNFARVCDNRRPQFSKCFRQMVIDAYKEEVMLYWSETHAIPWWMSVKWYRIFTSLLLAIPYRIMFGYATQRVRVRIQKVIYC